jgi:hypothetical protein
MLKPLFALSKGNLCMSAFCDVAKDHHMPAGQVVCGRGEVYENGCSVARDQLRAASLILILKKQVPSLRKRLAIRKEMTDVATNQPTDGHSQDNRRSGIRVQAIALIIDDQDSVEHILEDGGKFTVCVTESLVCLPMLPSKAPKRIDV